jgi:ribonucleoside-diphosphate reductase beta chain
MSERTFTTYSRGIDWNLFPMRLFQKAKQHGTWDPQTIDLSQDKKDWESFDADQKYDLVSRNALFQSGEEAVTLDLLPLIQVMAQEGRLEDEIYLTSFLWEEAKHTELFARFFEEVIGDPGDLSRFHTPAYQQIFNHDLPEALGRLQSDPSPVAQAEASVTYNLVIEGVLAETGYWAYYRTLAENDVMPGMLEAVALLKRDESRHLAYGVYLLSRLVAEHGDEVWQAIQTRMAYFQPLVQQFIQESEERREQHGHAPAWGVDPAETQAFAMQQFQARLTRIEKARQQSFEEINRLGSVFGEESAA